MGGKTCSSPGARCRAVACDRLDWRGTVSILHLGRQRSQVLHALRAWAELVSGKKLLGVLLVQAVKVGRAWVCRVPWVVCCWQVRWRAPRPLQFILITICAFVGWTNNRFRVPWEDRCSRKLNKTDVQGADCKLKSASRTWSACSVLG